MKKLVFWAMMTLGVISLQSCDKEDDNNLQISAGLQEAFDARYPHASRVDWERTGEFYEAEFTENGGEHKAWFTFEGVWVMTEYDIPFTQLPQAVQDAFAAGTYASWRVDDVDKIEKSDMSVVYIIEVESGTQEYELTYLEDGTLIRENTEWSEHLPVAPDQLSSVKELVKEMYPQASILDIEEEKGTLKWKFATEAVRKKYISNSPMGNLSGCIPLTKWKDTKSRIFPRLCNRLYKRSQEAEWK